MTKILHYTTGEPGVTKGGLMLYVEFLIDFQTKDNLFEKVFVLFPSHHSLFGNNPQIIEKSKHQKLVFAKLINPNKETLFEGTRFPLKSIKNKRIENAVVKYVIKNDINLVHFHTFFGIPSNLIAQLHNLGIKTVFSSHDYQPLCNKINLIDFNYKTCKNTENGQHCSICNKKALSTTQIKLRNNRIGVFFQKFDFIKTFAKQILRPSSHIQPNLEKDVFTINTKKAEEYLYRYKKNIDILNESIDVIIYNSYVTQKLFSHHGVHNDGYILPVTHLNFNNIIEKYNIEIPASTHIKFGFLGGDRPEKGGNQLIKIFEELANANMDNFELHYFGAGSKNVKIPDLIAEKVIIHGFQKENIFDKFEILVVPSYSETFGLVVPEALMHKKGVIASQYVGAVSFISEGIKVFSDFNDLKIILIELLSEGGSFSYIEGLEKLDQTENYKQVLKLYNL